MEVGTTPPPDQVGGWVSDQPQKIGLSLVKWFFAHLLGPPLHFSPTRIQWRVRSMAIQKGKKHSRLSSYWPQMAAFSARSPLVLVLEP